MLNSYYQISLHCPAHHPCCSMCLTKSLIFIPPMAVTWPSLTKLSNFSASFLSTHSIILHNLHMKWKSINSSFTSPSLAVPLPKFTEIQVKQNLEFLTSDPTYLLSVSHIGMFISTGMFLTLNFLRFIMAFFSIISTKNQLQSLTCTDNFPLY